MTLYDAALALLVVAIVVPLTIVAMQHRNRLLKKFDPTDMKIRSTCHLADGSSLSLVDVEGVTVLCASSRTGHIALQIMPDHGQMSDTPKVQS